MHYNLSTTKNYSEECLAESYSINVLSHNMNRYEGSVIMEVIIALFLELQHFLRLQLYINNKPICNGLNGITVLPFRTT